MSGSEPQLPPAVAPTPDGRRIKLCLARNVNAARRRAGMTQLQLARAAELSRATVHLIEAGAGDPRLSTVAQLAWALHVRTLDLLADAAREGTSARA